MNCLRSLECWDHGIESHSRHWCLYFLCLFCVYIVLCVGRGLATGRSSVQAVLPTVYRIKKLKKQPSRPKKGLSSNNNNKISVEQWIVKGITLQQLRTSIYLMMILLSRNIYKWQHSTPTAYEHNKNLYFQDSLTNKIVTCELVTC
jgi:hypothetical protein